jgi:transcriptional regulator with XRE-family HTH domain
MFDMKGKSIVARVRRIAGLTQQELAARAGTSQSAIARLESGQSSPTIATLERLAAAADCVLRIDFVPKAAIDPVVEAYKKDVDRTLLRENLRKSVDQRLRLLTEHQELGRELQRAVRDRKRRA